MSTQTADPAVLANRKTGEMPHAQPVGAVVPVLVQGSRQAAGAESRPQPFAEESKTVVVFQNGAVLRISEGVGPGQLVILKNLKTNREIACRIVKANDKMKGYFEIEFTQPEPGFWGVDFPAGQSVAEPSAHATVSAEPELKPATPADLAASTEELMEDLDRALASAFASLPKAPMKSPDSPKTGEAANSRTAPLASSIPANTVAIADSVENDSWKAAQAASVQPRQPAAPVRPSSYADNKKSRAGDPGLALMADFVATDSLHTSPSLSNPRFTTSEAAPRANWMWVLGGVAASVVLLAVGTGIYRYYNHDKPQDFLPPVTTSAPSAPQSQQGSPSGSSDPASANGQASQPANSNSAADSAASREKNASANRGSNPSAIPVENSGTVVTATTSRRSAVLDTKIKAPASPTKGSGGANIDAANLQVPASRSAADGASLGTLIPGSSVPAQPTAPAAPRISNMVQARLLTSVPPVYPQIAATQGIQGDVKLDLTVGDSGRVSETKVLSGPALLRDAAADAAKKWRYSPGKLDGSAVTTHVIVTVHFELKQE